MKYTRIGIGIALCVSSILMVWYVWNTPAYAPIGIDSIPRAAYSGGASIDKIIITSLKPGDAIVSPLTLSGSARGTWYFEASFPIIVVDWDGRIIGQGYATALDDWMTEDFVPFRATVTFDRPDIVTPGTYNERGAIIFKNDNPSGDPTRDMAVEVPIVFK